MLSADITAQSPRSTSRAARLLGWLVCCLLLLLPAFFATSVATSERAEARIFERIVSKSRAAVRKTVRRIRVALSRRHVNRRSSRVHMARVSRPSRPHTAPAARPHRIDRSPRPEPAPCCQSAPVIDRAPAAQTIVTVAALAVTVPPIPIPPLPVKQPRPWHKPADGKGPVIVAMPASRSEPPTVDMNHPAAASLDGRLVGGLMFGWAWWRDLAVADTAMAAPHGAEADDRTPSR